MSGFASKNLYDLLGNDLEQDPDQPQPAPVQPVDKPAARLGKRNGPAEAPAQATTTTSEAQRGGRGGRGRGRGRGDYSGNEGAFRDRDAGRSSNRERPTEEGSREDRGGRVGGDRPRREFGEGQRGERRGGRDFRGGRGGRGPRDDRHSRGVTSDPNDHAKQAAHGWGDSTGAGEWKDEQAGQAIAAADEKDAAKDAGAAEPTSADGENPASGFDMPAPLADEPQQAEPEVEAEPEDKSKSYATYLAELAEKKLGLGGLLTARQANEGSSQKFEGKAIERADGTEAYMAGAGGKAKRDRERKEKNTLQLDHDIQAREQTGGFRGGRGGDRGDRGGRGGGRGRGEGGFRGERGGRGRGGFRGESRGDFRGEHRGGRGGGPSSPNVTNERDFPTLGGK